MTSEPEVRDWVWVPREPTREMWAAMADALVANPDLHHDIVTQRLWDNLVAAAPPPPAAAGEVEELAKELDAKSWQSTRYKAGYARREDHITYRAATLLRSLSARIAELEREWRSIETAQEHDGLLLLAVRNGEERRTFVASADFPPSGFRWIIHSQIGGHILHRDWEPTHWRPLPAPPVSQHASDAGEG